MQGQPPNKSRVRDASVLGTLFQSPPTSSHLRVQFLRQCSGVLEGEDFARQPFARALQLVSLILQRPRPAGIRPAALVPELRRFPAAAPTLVDVQQRSRHRIPNSPEAGGATALTTRAGGPVPSMSISRGAAGVRRSRPRLIGGLLPTGEHLERLQAAPDPILRRPARRRRSSTLVSESMDGRRRFLTPDGGSPKSLEA